MPQPEAEAQVSSKDLHKGGTIGGQHAIIELNSSYKLLVLKNPEETHWPEEP